MKDCPVKYALDVLSGKWTMLRQGACREFVSEWMLQLGVRFRFTQAGEPEMLGLRPDSPAIIASVSEEVLVSAAFFAEHLRLPWSDARTLAEYVHAWADRHLDDAWSRQRSAGPERSGRTDRSEARSWIPPS